MKSILTSIVPTWKPLCLLCLSTALSGLAFAADEPASASDLASQLQQETTSQQQPDPEIRECPRFLENLEPVAEMDLRVQPAPAVPDSRRELFTTADPNVDARRPWAPRSFYWAASETYHQPLYFDDTPLERYGQSAGPLVQPWLSGGHFFATLPLVPYKIGLDRTHDRIYTLGQHRPGSPTPNLRSHLPLRLDAAVVEGMTWTALLLVLP